MGLNDLAPRVNFCRWLLGQTVLVPHFLRFMFFPDECAFTKDGIFQLQKLPCMVSRKS
jgi:hypothetical protein